MDQWIWRKRKAGPVRKKPGKAAQKQARQRRADGVKLFGSPYLFPPYLSRVEVVSRHIFRVDIVSRHIFDFPGHRRRTDTHRPSPPPQTMLRANHDVASDGSGYWQIMADTDNPDDDGTTNNTKGSTPSHYQQPLHSLSNARHKFYSTPQSYSRSSAAVHRTRTNCRLPQLQWQWYEWQSPPIAYDR